MDPAEVLAIEIKQFIAGKTKTLVPRVIGQTESARKKKTVTEPSGRKWDAQSFFTELENKFNQKVAKAASEILKWATNRKIRIWRGKGKTSGSFYPMFDYKGQTYWSISVWTYGRLEINFLQMKARAPFSKKPKRLELLAKFNSISEINLPEDSIDRRPSMLLEAFKEEKNSIDLGIFQKPVYKLEQNDI